MKTDGFAFTLAVRIGSPQHGHATLLRRGRDQLVSIVVAADINPLPAIRGRHLSPAGVVRIIVVGTTVKAEREESIAMMVLQRPKYSVQADFRDVLHPAIDCAARSSGGSHFS